MASVTCLHCKETNHFPLVIYLLAYQRNILWLKLEAIFVQPVLFLRKCSMISFVLVRQEIGVVKNRFQLQPLNIFANRSGKKLLKKND